MPDPDVTALRTVLVDAMKDWPMPEAEKEAHLRQFDAMVSEVERLRAAIDLLRRITELPEAQVDDVEAENRRLRANREALHRLVCRIDEVGRSAGGGL